jgi:hypothetical protein
MFSSTKITCLKRVFIWVNIFLCILKFKIALQLNVRYHIYSKEIFQSMYQEKIRTVSKQKNLFSICILDGSSYMIASQYPITKRNMRILTSNSTVCLVNKLKFHFLSSRLHTTIVLIQSTEKWRIFHYLKQFLCLYYYQLTLIFLYQTIRRYIISFVLFMFPIPSIRVTIDSCKD